jgi:hypothetical protein
MGRGSRLTVWRDAGLAEQMEASSRPEREATESKATAQLEGLDGHSLATQAEIHARDIALSLASSDRAVVLQQIGEAVSTDQTLGNRTCALCVGTAAPRLTTSVFAGDQLFVAISQHYPKDAAKITGDAMTLQQPIRTVCLAKFRLIALVSFLLYGRRDVSGFCGRKWKLDRGSAASSLFDEIFPAPHAAGESRA